MNVVQFYFTAALRPYTDQQRSVDIDTTDLHEGIRCLVEIYPKLQPYLLSATNTLHPFVNLYLNGQDIRTLDKTSIQNLKPQDKIEILLSLAGG